MGILLLIAIFVNHLNGEDSFPFSSSYQFPAAHILVTFFMGMLTIAIADYNFIHHSKKYFQTEVTKKVVLRFGGTTLFYYVLLYIPIYFIFNLLIGEEGGVYDFVIGLSITVLLSVVFLIVFYGRDVFRLFNRPQALEKLMVKNGATTTLIEPAEIAYFYSKYKLVYLVKTSNESIPTDFTLNQLEKQLKQQNYFRANRQFLLHTQSIHQVKPIENGKLSVALNQIKDNQAPPPIIVSRYKKQAFMNWFGQKL